MIYIFFRLKSLTLKDCAREKYKSTYFKYYDPIIKIILIMKMDMLAYLDLDTLNIESSDYAPCSDSVVIK